MIKPFILYSFFILGLSIPLPVKSQQSWTLQDCIKYAIDNNLQIKRQEVQTEISKNNYLQSKLSLLPNLQAGASRNFGIGLRINPFTSGVTDALVLTDNYYASSTVTLFNGLQEIRTVEQNRYLLDKSLQDYQKAKNDISMQIAEAFLQILFGEENLVVTQQQVEYSHDQTEKMRKLLEVGNKAKGDLLVMQASEANDRYNYITAKNNLTISYLTLTQLLELKSAEGFNIQIPDSLSIDEVTPLTSVEDIYKTAVSNLPQIKSSEFDLKNYEKSVSIARGQLSPQVSLSGGYSTGYENDYPGSYSQQLHLATYKYATFSINIPLFNRYQTRTNISNAKLKVVDSQYSLEQVKKSLYKDIQNAYTDAVAALEKYHSASESINSNTEAFKYSQQKYDVGLLSAVDYNLAKTNLIKAKSDLISAKYEYIFKVKILDFYKGLPIVL